VIEVSSEGEVQRLLKLAKSMQVPVTFRAAGTSLSGQAVTDSVLIRIIPSAWNKCQVLSSCNNPDHVHHTQHDSSCATSNDCSSVLLQPGVIGGNANAVLRTSRSLSPSLSNAYRLRPLRRLCDSQRLCVVGWYGKKIGPDPSSMDACMIGGIVANNSSGMCCGTAQNTYNTLKSMRIIFADGTLLDTASESSRQAFEQTHGALLDGLRQLSQQIRSNAELCHKIVHKYKIKNTTGYSLNALVDFDDPFEILQHLIVGSEGTLAFVCMCSEAQPGVREARGL
jgi:D-lactate dehydrogenase